MKRVDAASVPETTEALAELLRSLRAAREAQKKKLGRRPREFLSAADRRTILAKTEGRCHICGGVLDERWEADHVLAHSAGGLSKADNYLPAHRLCNGYRWDYLPEELQVILKMGVWARGQVETKTGVGRLIGEAFLKQERRRIGRRRNSSRTSNS